MNPADEKNYRDGLRSARGIDTAGVPLRLPKSNRTQTASSSRRP